MRRYCIRPWVLNYVDRSRANREAEHQAFLKRRDEAIAKAATTEQGVGE